jgi:Cu+-exporting ATPase
MSTPSVSPHRDASEPFELPIQGMTCANCARRVEEALAAVPGVTEAHVNFATRTASVAHLPTLEAQVLERAVEAAGYHVIKLRGKRLGARERLRALDAAAREERAALRRDLISAVVLSVPLLVLGMSHGAIPWADTNAGRYVALALCSLLVFGPARRFFVLALTALKHRSSDMNSLVSLGVLAAYGYSAVAVLFPALFAHAEHGRMPHVYFEAAGSVVSFVLLGKVLEARAQRHLADAVRALVALTPERATRLQAEEPSEVAVEDIEAGEILLVRPGERIALDGTVVTGTSAVDEAMLTGESLPVDKSDGAPVFAGTLNQSGVLRVRVTRIGPDTALARIIDAVETAQGARAPIARLADVVSSYFVPAVLACAFVTLAAWLVADSSATGIAHALERMVAVLVIACPCALGLATPAAVAVGTGRGAELSVLVKGGAVLEALSRVDTVFFDKTGTLTLGKPKLAEVVAMPGTDLPRLLTQVASVERESEHPVARAVSEGAVARGATLKAVTQFSGAAGQGVQGRVEKVQIRIGTSRWLEAAGVSTEPLDARAAELATLGHTVFFVAAEGRLGAILAVRDEARPETPAVLTALRGMGLRLAMVSGDRRATAEAIAKDLGIDDVYAEVLPEEKAQVVARAQARGAKVAMVGDGVNDAPALTQADVGIAVGSGADVAMAAADVALLGGGIAALPTALRLGRRTLTVIRQNLFWAFAYNVVGIPLAAGLLVPVMGFELSPVFASFAMSSSSVSVLLSSLRLARFRG